MSCSNDDKPCDEKGRSGDGSSLKTLRENSIKTAGYAYLAGDAALFAAGIARGDIKDATAGLLWAVGGLAAARYGNPGKDKMLDILGDQLGTYLKDHHIEIPKDATTEVLTRKHGVIDHIEAFLYSHPSEMLNAAYAIGGAQMIGSGFSTKKSSNHWSAVSGALVTAGALTGLLCQQKAPDPDHPPVGAFEKCKAWIQEKPLRVSGTLYALNNVSLVMGALKDRKTHPGNLSSTLKFLTAATYIFGNSMLFISSKGHGDNQKEAHSAMQELANGAAHVIASQPEKMREALVQQISGYLAAQPEAQMKADEISALLHGKLAQVARDMPIATGGDMTWQQRTHSPQGPQPSPAL